MVENYSDRGRGYNQNLLFFLLLSLFNCLLDKETLLEEGFRRTYGRGGDRRTRKQKLTTLLSPAPSSSSSSSNSLWVGARQSVLPCASPWWSLWCGSSGPNTSGPRGVLLCAAIPSGGVALHRLMGWNIDLRAEEVTLAAWESLLGPGHSRYTERGSNWYQKI